jgi:hypothetical protein
MDAAQRHVKLDIRTSSIRLWTGVMAGPVAFAAAFETRYALVHYMCLNHAPWLSWLIIFGGLLIAGVGALCSWSGWIDDTPRVRFMAIGGLYVDAMFALAILAMAVPDFFLKACE